MTSNESAVVTGIAPSSESRALVAKRFRHLLEAGAKLKPVGAAKRDPAILLSRRYTPRHSVSLFGTTLFLADYSFDEALGFFVGYVAAGEAAGRRVRSLHPRIFYKDSSLMWRVASHYIHDELEYWIGKGDTREIKSADGELVESVEETANLPYELQGALDEVSRRTKRKRDDNAVELIVRQAPSGRVEPYPDFTAPRRKAAERGRINGGRRVAMFGKTGDPKSLRFVRGYEPDLKNGIVEVFHAHSKFFGGALDKYRILSANQRIQYLFYSSPTHTWINPPQALTTELSTFGVRVDDVQVHDDLVVPGYEYHEPGHSQIPSGFAGKPHPKDPHRADARAWLDRLPVIIEFKRRVLGRRK